MSSSVSTVTPSTGSLTPFTDSPISPTPTTTSNDRVSPFTIALLLLFVQALAVILLSSLPSSFPSALLSIGLALFTYEWLLVHSSSLTRRRRPLFDEVNILETYQPRARTMGHLFVGLSVSHKFTCFLDNCSDRRDHCKIRESDDCSLIESWEVNPPTAAAAAIPSLQPDPPTPSPNDDRPQRTKEGRDAFTAARDAHYENQAIEAASKRAEIDLFLKASAGSSELIPTSKRIDFSKMTIEEIIEKRRKEKAEAEKEKKEEGKSQSKSSTSSNENTEKYGVIKRENL
ncbi:hypothetical protein PRIPAC_72639 [Pristionchus pacificus]|uniref:Uncharacterized protein n=1 Tax=Pristionchus pacificus TaxID=54126 RepID=A0A2A6BFB2_PRIPA|nr:hypothetical protein PRIPAC_72639 [Pristionchus pacificus]|eukprot:PDM64543.1 hypothetical protein PRIPAC_52799 [Pristionchus pacificus]